MRYFRLNSIYGFHASNAGSVHTHESAIDDHAERTPGMYSSRDVTLIAFLTPYVKLAHCYTACELLHLLLLSW